MKPLDVVDVTLRDGHQSLWATRMTTAMFFPILKRMDDVGFKVIDFTGAMHFEVQVRFLREDPWERIRLARKIVEKTPLNCWMRPKNVISFETMPDDVIALWIERLAANGIRRLTTFDPLFDLSNMALPIRTAKRVGMSFLAALPYSLSPVHTDDLFARATKTLVELGADAILLKDPGGLLTPERVRTIVPAIQAQLAGRPLEIHSHCLTGLAPLCYLEAIRLGVDAIQTAISPLANGSSLPATERLVNHAKRLGSPVRIDEAGLLEMAAHFKRVAEATGKPIGLPVEYDPRQYEHQLPGGMISNLRAQLAQIGLAQRFDEVLDEVARVRVELGYLNMVTPFAQLVGTQAVINVVLGARYRTIPDEIVKYALGKLGKPLAPIDPNVLDRILGTPGAAQYMTLEPPPPLIEGSRARFGPSISDDELLLRISIPDKFMESMKAEGPIKTSFPSALTTPLAELVRRVINQRRVAYVHVERKGLRLTARRKVPGSGSRRDETPKNGGILAPSQVSEPDSKSAATDRRDVHRLVPN